MANTPKAVPAPIEIPAPAPAEVIIPVTAETDVSQAPHQQPLDMEKLEAMKDHLKQMIDAMNQGTSYLSRAAKFWAEIPLWQKIAGGVMLVVPLFLLTALFQSVVFFCISIFTAIAYTAGSILLDNHTNENLDRTQNLKKGVDGLADLLIGIISTTYKICTDLGVQTTRLTGLSEKITINVGNLDNGVSSLSKENSLLRQARSDLGTVKDDFAAQVENLRLFFMQQKMASDDAQKLYAADQKRFKAELAKLTELHGSHIDALKNALEALNGIIGVDAEKRNKFNAKLNEMVSNTKVSFTTMAGQLSEHVNQLNTVATDYQDLNGKHGALLGRSESLVSELEALKKAQEAKIAQLNEQIAANVEKDRELARLREEVQQLRRLHASNLALVQGGDNLFKRVAQETGPRPMRGVVAEL